MPMYVGKDEGPFEARFIMRGNYVDIAEWGGVPYGFAKANIGNYACMIDGLMHVAERHCFDRKYKEVS